MRLQLFTSNTKKTGAPQNVIPRDAAVATGNVSELADGVTVGTQDVTRKSLIFIEYSFLHSHKKQAPVLKSAYFNLLITMIYLFE